MTLNEALHNNEIAEKIEEANNMEDILAALKKYGIETTEEELMNAISEENGELSDDQLEDVAGGLINILPFPPPTAPTRITIAIIKLIKSGKLKPFNWPKSLKKMLKL